MLVLYFLFLIVFSYNNYYNPYTPALHNIKVPMYRHDIATVTMRLVTLYISIVLVFSVIYFDAIYVSVEVTKSCTNKDHLSV